VRRVKRFDPAEVLPPRDAVLRRMEMPAGAAVSAALEGLLTSAQARFLEIADPIAIAEPISLKEFANVYRGDGRNEPKTPLDQILKRAQRLALFVATIGQPISTEISGAFVSGDPALGLVLDGFASEGVNRLAYLFGADLAERFRRRSGVSADAIVLPYSPGYCGWHVSGQRALFASIHSDTIGVTLGGSCLMVPMKSISGVFVAAPPAVHRFRPTFAFCDECTTRECLLRMASLKSA
jgi:hypothetical protein